MSSSLDNSNITGNKNKYLTTTIPVKITAEIFLKIIINCSNHAKEPLNYVYECACI